jgi:hypothetical protein
VKGVAAATAAGALIAEPTAASVIGSAIIFL